jgi:hypothetical protein
VDGLPWLTHADFAERVGEVFEVARDGGAAVSLTLVDATEGTETGGTGPDGATRLQFSLEFHGPGDTPLPQATYRLLNDALGGLDLFLVPLGPQAGAMRYEAAFA